MKPTVTLVAAVGSDGNRAYPRTEALCGWWRLRTLATTVWGLRQVGEDSGRTDVRLTISTPGWRRLPCIRLTRAERWGKDRLQKVDCSPFSAICISGRRGRTAIPARTAMSADLRNTGRLCWCFDWPYKPCLPWNGPTLENEPRSGPLHCWGARRQHSGALITGGSKDTRRSKGHSKTTRGSTSCA